MNSRSLVDRLFAAGVIPYAILLTVTIALYSGSLYFQFVWDDVGYITRNYRIQKLDWMHIHAFWTQTYFGHYAPVHHTLLAVLYHFSALDPFAYHLVQVALHAGCVCLVYSILKRLEGARVALLGGLLFAVHPTNIETVAWISETKSTLALLLFLLSFHYFIRFRERESVTDGLMAGALLVLSILAKINTIVGPIVFLLYDYRNGASLKTLRWKSLAPFFLLSAVFVAIHLRAFHGSAQTMEAQYLGGRAVHWMNFPLLLSFYLKMIVFPSALSAWQMFPVQLRFTAVAALAWAGFAALGWIVYRSNRVTKFWALWIVVFLLPVLQLVPFPIWVADRYLYVPLIGGVALAAQGFFWLWQRYATPSTRLALAAAMAIIVAVLAWRTEQHLPAWRDDLTLWTATTPTCITSAYCHMNLGLARLQNGQMEPGIAELIEAVKLRAGPRMLERLGDAFTLGARDYPRAVTVYSLAIQKEGRSPVTELYGRLARAHYLAGDLEEATRVIEAGKTVNPNDLGLWITHGFVLWRQGRWEEARYSLRRSLAMAGGSVNSAQFFTEFLGKPGEVGRLLADLRSSDPGVAR